MKPVKKRPLDEIDHESQKSKTRLRNRFSARERDLLVFLRALSYFLCPNSRVWVKPAVIRDIMHNCIPEARSKTAISLSQASQRELNRGVHRMSQWQRLITRMETIQELKQLRKREIITNALSEEERAVIFTEAFEIAYREMLGAGANVPLMNEKKLCHFLSENTLRPSFGDRSEQSHFTKFVWYAREAVTEQEIRFAALQNVIISHYLSNGDGEELMDYTPQLNAIFEQFSGQFVTDVVRELRIEGLLSRRRVPNRASIEAKREAAASRDINGPPSAKRLNTTEDSSDIAFINDSRSDLLISYYYRHFFHNKYDRAVMDVEPLMQQLIKEHATGANLLQENTGYLAAVSSLLCYDAIQFDVSTVDGGVVSSASSSVVSGAPSSGGLHFAPKSMRMQEVGELRVDRMRLIGRPKSDVAVSAVVKACRASVTAFQAVMKRLKTDVHTEVEPFDHFLAKFDEETAKILTSISSALSECGLFGATEEELQKKVGEPEAIMKRHIGLLLTDEQVLVVGVFSRRYVLRRFADSWLIQSYLSRVQNGDDDKEEIRSPIRYSPRPWLRLDGSLNLSVVRWMAEGLMTRISVRPGVVESELQEEVAHALAPHFTADIIQLLVEIGCVRRRTVKRRVKNLAGPFDVSTSLVSQTYLEPVCDWVTKFSAIFNMVSLPSILQRQENIDGDDES